MIGVRNFENIAGILYQSMLKAPSSSQKGHTPFAGEADRAQSAVHAAIRAARSAPDRITLSQPSFGGIVIQGIGIDPYRSHVNFQSFGGMSDRLFRGHVIFVPWIIISNDSNAKSRFHIDALYYTKRWLSV
jgi:hypothetical protein